MKEEPSGQPNSANRMPGKSLGAAGTPSGSHATGNSVSPPDPKGDQLALLPPKAPPSEAAAAPSDTQRKSLKRYPLPHYATDSEPLALTEVNTKRSVFAVEEVQCSEEGNWLIGYLAELETADDGNATLAVRQRHALNNYPGERAATVQELRNLYQDTGGLECDAGQRECSAPSFQFEKYADYRQEILRARNSNGPVADWTRQYTCRPDKGICVSQERDYWRCGPDGRCLAYDPSRWWCAVRQEFCFSRVSFGDWGSWIRENEIIQLKLDQSAGSGLFFDMAHGFLPIAQAALMRVCGSGQASLWKASWSKQK